MTKNLNWIEVNNVVVNVACIELIYKLDEENYEIVMPKFKLTINASKFDKIKDNLKLISESYEEIPNEIIPDPDSNPDESI